MKFHHNELPGRAERDPVWQQLLQLALILAAVCGIGRFSGFGIVRADEDTIRLVKNQSRGLSAVFDMQVLADNFPATVGATTNLPAGIRYEALARWVLPVYGDSSFRLPMAFHHPATETIRSATTTEWQRPPLSAVIDLQSPVIDLVHAASDADKLPELRDRILNIPSGDSMHERNRQTLLILVDLENGDVDSAQRRISDAFAILQTLDRTELGIRCPETLAVFQGIQNEATRGICQEILSFLVDSLIRADRIGSIDPWDRAIPALAGWARMQNSEYKQNSDNLPPHGFHQWSPVSRVTQRSRGTGFPAAHWIGDRGQVFNATSHDEDYLYFQSPLRGDFEVECDLSSVHWQHSHLMVCGEWIAPVWGRSVVQVGCFQRLLKEVVIDPPLSVLEGWIRLRTVIRGDVRSTYINGRLVEEKQLPKNSDPWLAIRSPWYAEGGVRNLRITGDPEIPDTIHLPAEPGLNQWIPGFDAIMGHDWAVVEDPSGDQIVGVRRDSEFGPVFRENVLHYHRPLMEDGAIEYEFVYQDGESHVHPALDDVAFMLLPDGVCLHQITNGIYDRTGADPARVVRYPAGRRGANSLPLKHGDWNRMQLKMAGNLLQLSLNGELIFEQTLETSKQRRFGLFHYADQTQAVIRNIRWNGAWPDMLPPESDQELADPAQSYHELAGTPVFRHSFVDQGAPGELFNMVGFLPGGSTADARSDGLHIQCRGEVGCIMCFVSPNLQVEGDFDLTAEFDRLTTVGDVNCSSGVFLTAVVNSTPVTEASVYRGLIHNEHQPARQTTLSQVASLSSDGIRMSWSAALSEESTSGKLRLMRRGKRIRCFLAEGDSLQFRMVSEEEINDSPLTADGIRLVAMAHESTGLTEVVWKNIEVRATKLTAPAVENRAEVVAELDRLRDQLTDHFIHDFTSTPPEAATFYRWRDTRPWEKSAGGLKIRAQGTLQWLTSGINIRREIIGDFDYVVFVNELSLATPAVGLVSGIYLVVPASDKDRTHVTLHFRKLEDGRSVIVVGTGKVDAGATKLETLRTLDFKSISALRVARHKGKLTCLVSSPDFDRDQVIASIDFPEEPIPSTALQLHLLTGGAGLESEVLIPRIEIRATRILGD